MSCGPRVCGQYPYEYRVALPPTGLPIISRPSSGSLGWFDNWPLDLLTETLEGMDMKSMLAFSRVSVRAYNLVHSLSAYKEVMEHAKGAVSILGATGLLAHHSASSLRRALRSPRACSGFGALLFLPTCQRACGDCLIRKAEFQVCTPEEAGALFSLTKEQLASIPELRLPPDIYAVDPDHDLPCISGSLVSFKQVYDLAAHLPKEAAWWHPNLDIQELVEILGGSGQYSGPSYIRFPFLDAAGRNTVGGV